MWDVMPICYDEALLELAGVTDVLRSQLRDGHEYVRLVHAVGRVLQHDLFAPLATPLVDTSAMDGYAVNSTSTRCASDSNPLVLQILGTMAAGDAPISLPMHLDLGQVLPCAEIMTGAQFPTSASEAFFDACIPNELAQTVDLPGRTGRYIQITKPAVHSQHRRFAGGDYRKGQLVIRASTVIEPHHVMAMASLGLTGVSVWRQLRVGVWSTGAELFQGDSSALQRTIHDANGPFLISSLQRLSVEVDFLGILQDNLGHVQGRIAESAASGKYDLLITTGAVSAGKFDHMRQAVEDVGGRIHFHKVAVRPGHPILFATLPPPSSPQLVRSTAFFGLPGNPVATAACLRFFVAPFIRRLYTQTPDLPIHARLAMFHSPNHDHSSNSHTQQHKTPGHLDIFRHGTIYTNTGTLVVCVSKDQSPGRVQTFAGANCWIHLPQGSDKVKVGDLVRCFSLVAGEPLQIHAQACSGDIRSNSGEDSGLV